MSKVYKGEILGELRLGNNDCTDRIKVHPVMSGDWFLIPPDLTNGQKQHQYEFTTLIAFDGRQVWEVYYYACRDGGMWVAERKGMYLRMPAKDFERFFGRYRILPKDAPQKLVTLVGNEREDG